MNIQIFGTNKCNDTKKAVRYFKERKIKYQFIDMKQKGMSRGELAGVIRAVGGFENLLDESRLLLLSGICQKAAGKKHFSKTSRL